VTLIRSVSGVRGVVGLDLSADVAWQYARAFGLMAGGDVAVGWDSRPNGNVLKRAVEEGLSASGARVRDLGIVPTPTVGITVRSHGLAGGMAITASHNPEEYNGLKFFSPEGVFLGAAEIAELFDAADGELPECSVDGPDPVALDGAIDEHIRLVASSRWIDAAGIAARRPRVVVDCVNAAGSVIIPRLLRELGCEVLTIHCDEGRGFPRGAEPVPAHLADLSKAVRESTADLGLACDPDADRLAIVDEGARPVGEELTLVLAARIVLEKTRGPVVANLSTSRMIEDLAAEFDVPVYRSSVGEINVVMKMTEVSAVVGGEGNGGVIVPDIHPGRDAATAAALIVSALAGDGRPSVSGLVSRFRPYVMVKRKVPVGAVSRAALEAAMRAAFPDGDLDLTDGAKMLWPDRWIHARMSGTEPIVRVISEAESREDAEALVERAASAVSGATGGDRPCAG
jgi:phosphomannomutase